MSKIKKASVLFVDDDEYLVNLFKMMFRSKYNVFTAIRGAEGLEIVKQNDIDVVISDQRMPEMLGNEMLAEVKEISPHSVRILLTGYSDLTATVAAINTGEVYRFLNKPWDQEELKDVVKESVEIAQKSKASTNAEVVEKSAESLQCGDITILSLEDSAEYQQEIIDILMQDFEVITASNIGTAMDTIKEKKIGVVITDTNIEGENTISFLKAVRKYHPCVSIIINSEVVDETSIIKLINETGVFRYSVKPVSSSNLELTVSAAIREYHRLLADTRMNDTNGENE